MKTTMAYLFSMGKRPYAIACDDKPNDAKEYKRIMREYGRPGCTVEHLPVEEAKAKLCSRTSDSKPCETISSEVGLFEGGA
jgi:hypothetical protein